MSLTILGAVLFIAGGFALLYYGGDLVVVGAVRLSARLGVHPVVIGLTVVAFGTSLPELLVSLMSALQGHNVVAVGNILGSDIFNISLIVGAAAVLANPLEGSPQVARRDMPVLVLGMALFGILGRDLVFTAADGLVLVLVFAAYLTLTVARPAREEACEVVKVLEEFEDESDRTGPSVATVEGAQAALAREPYVGRLVGGLVALPLGAHLLVQGGVDLARLAGVSERFIAMTLVSWGTSLPEMATSLAAAYHGQSAICIGNIVGSNIFNTVLIMGVTALATPVTLLAVSFRADYVLACAVTLLLAVLLRGGRPITRVGGLVLLASFLVMFVLLAY